ncbi:MAG: hypothetical protein BWK76_10015 [Desulfobulbaceae bacterium A2]|nr:MAG: hypothetical protein BWK76_10015 [Desulfobulbaceae bacterium A2]
MGQLPDVKDPGQKSRSLLQLKKKYAVFAGLSSQQSRTGSGFQVIKLGKRILAHAPPHQRSMVAGLFRWFLALVR